MTPDSYAADLVRALGLPAETRIESIVRAVMPIRATDTGPVRIEGGAMLVNQALPVHRQRWLVAQEFAGYAMKVDGWDAGAVKAGRSAVAAALLMPADRFLRDLEAGRERTAEQLSLPLGSVWMREGELRERPVAVVLPDLRWARVAGDPRGRLDPEECLRVATYGLRVVGLSSVVTPDGETLFRVG